MLFKSSIPMVMNRMHGELYTAATAARKREAAKRLNYFHSSQLDELESLLTQFFSEPDKLQKVTLNVVRKIIVNLSQIFLQPPKRELIGGTDKDKEVYTEILESSSFDARIKQASRYTKLLGNTLIRPVWRNDALSMDILTGNILDIETGDSPEELKAVMITDYGSTDKIENIEFSYWTPETFQRLDYRGNVLQEESNPYNILPFVPCFDYPPPGNSFWLENNQDLISVQEAINLKLTDLMHLISMQSFGVGWIRGSEGGGTMRIDAGSVVELGPEGAIGWESQRAEIGAVISAIDKLQKWCAVSYGLPVSTMATDPTSSNRTSGAALAYRSRELQEARRDDVSLWRGYEKQLFQLVKLVHNTHTTGPKLSEKCSLSIDFYDPSGQSVSAKEQSETYQNLLELGVISPVDIAMERNPDLTTREKALEYLLTVQSEISELSNTKP